MPIFHPAQINHQPVTSCTKAVQRLHIETVYAHCLSHYSHEVSKYRWPRVSHSTARIYLRAFYHRLPIPFQVQLSYLIYFYTIFFSPLESKGYPCHAHYWMKGILKDNIHLRHAVSMKKPYLVKSCLTKICQMYTPMAHLQDRGLSNVLSRVFFNEILVFVSISNTSVYSLIYTPISDLAVLGRIEETNYCSKTI